jgi:hypothetical protein
MAKIITVGDKVVTTTSEGVVYALAIKGEAGAVSDISGESRTGTTYGSDASTAWTVAIPSDAIAIEGYVYVYGSSAVPDQATAGDASVTFSICGVTLLTNSRTGPGSVNISGTCLFWASRTNASETSWAVNCKWMDSTTGTASTTGVGTSPTKLIILSARNHTYDLTITAGSCTVYEYGLANYTA